MQRLCHSPRSPQHLDGAACSEPHRRLEGLPRCRARLTTGHRSTAHPHMDRHPLFLRLPILIIITTIPHNPTRRHHHCSPLSTVAALMAMVRLRLLIISTSTTSHHHSYRLQVVRDSMGMVAATWDHTHQCTNNNNRRSPGRALAPPAEHRAVTGEDMGSHRRQHPRRLPFQQPHRPMTLRQTSQQP